MNNEYYPDPTAETALWELGRKGYMPFVYVCSSENEDIDMKKKYSKYVYDCGNIPLDPYLLFPQFLDIEEEKQIFLMICKAVLSHCKKMWIFGDDETPDMKMIIEKAQSRGKVITRIDKKYYI